MAISLSGSLEITGSIYATGGITGSFSGTATSASYALIATSASYANNATSASYAANSDLLDGRDSLTFANTGSNAFVGQQNINGAVAITGSLTTTGAITAQTLNVQQVTSSIVYSSGSNVFGNSVSNTQSMTGSVGISGSLSVNGTTTITGTLIQQNITDGTNLIGLNTSNSVRQFNLFSTTTYSSLGTVTNNPLYLGTNDTTILTIAATTGNVGIGTTSPLNVFQVGTTFPITFNSNYPQIHFNSYYDSGYKVVSTGYGSHMYLDGSTGKLIYQNGPSSVSAGGLYSPTTKFVIDTDGNVGIGTASPTQLLQVGGNAASMAIGDGLTTNGTSRLKFTSSNSVTNWQISNNDSIAGAFEIMPSTAAGGKTFTTPVFSIASTGAATFSASVKATTGFNSLTGTNSVANTTWTAIYLIPDTQAAEGVYYVYAHYNDASDGMAYLQVLADRTYARSINGSNSTVQVRLSGKYIEVYQSYGATVDIQWSILIQKLR